MEPPRRFAKLMSALFLATGMLLLIYVAGTWFLALQPPPALQAPDGRSSLIDLPPALDPAAQNVEAAEPKTAVNELTETADPSLDPPGDAALLLPESPLMAHEAASDAAAALPEPAAADSRPLRIIIPALGVDAPVMAASLQTKQEGQRHYQQWAVPNAYAAGWHENSAPLGQPGNTVLNGHNNVHGAIFGELRKLAVGEQIVLVGADAITVYRVAHHELVPESGRPLRERLQNARWIGPTEDQRLTLVTCWPNTTNSHRLIVVALPEGETQSLPAPAG